MNREIKKKIIITSSTKMLWSKTIHIVSKVHFVVQKLQILEKLLNRSILIFVPKLTVFKENQKKNIFEFLIKKSIFRLNSWSKFGLLALCASLLEKNNFSIILI